MTLRNNLECVPKSLSAVKSPEMTTPFFVRSATFNIAISSKQLELQFFFERLKIFRMVILGRSLDILQENG